MAAVRPTDPAASLIVQPPSPSISQDTVVTNLAKQALEPPQNGPGCQDDIPSKLENARSLFHAGKYSEAADAFRQLFFLLNGTTNVPGLLYRSLCLHYLANCMYRIHGSFEISLIKSALADLSQVQLKLESASDSAKQMKYYQMVKTQYEALQTWDNGCDSAFLLEKIRECEEKARQLQMRVQLAHQETTPSSGKGVVLPLKTLQDDHEFAEMLAQVESLIQEYHTPEAGVLVLKFKESLKDPLDPQELIWRAHCNMKLAECAYLGRHNLDPEIRSKNQTLMHSLPLAAFQDLESARESLGFRKKISSALVRHELYRRLCKAYQELSRFEYSESSIKAKELSQLCLEKSKTVPNPFVEEISISYYSRYKNIFYAVIACLAAVLAASLYYRIIVKK